MVKEIEKKLIDTIAFYNAVAPAYNKTLEADQSNAEVRSRVADYFVKAVQGKTVLDFGGGTGLDLPWLAKNNFEVSFFEPSEAMRQYAVELCNKSLKDAPIRIITELEPDFTYWNTEHFDIKFNGVLANFAVLNSIQNLTALFEQLAKIMKPKAHIIANLIDTTYQGILKYHKRNFLKAAIMLQQPVLLTVYEGMEHHSFLHTPSTIRQSAPQFICRAVKPLKGFGFMLVDLQLK